MITRVLDAYANEFNVGIVVADLGEWNAQAQLNSEYDPAIPEIRINRCALTRLSSEDAQVEFVTLAIGHELYHHFEHLGEVHRFRDRRIRERIANEFAKQFLNATRTGLQ